MDQRTRVYLSGYADGEGCFTVTFNRSQRHRFGWEIRPSFSVSQNADRAEVLEIFKRTFGCGSIRPDRSDKTLKYEVRSIGELISHVLPHFEQHPLYSSKQRDFERFAAIVRLMHRGQHLSSDGFAQIAKLAGELNSSGKKRYVRSEILPISEQMKV
jgi:hypothetical protein